MPYNLLGCGELTSVVHKPSIGTIVHFNIIVNYGEGAG